MENLFIAAAVVSIITGAIRIINFIQDTFNKKK